MTAWIAYADPLSIGIDQAIVGQNFPDNRSIWFGLTNITFGTGNIVGAQWYKDSGPLAVDDSILEPRAFCTKGNATIAFSGRTLIIRVNIAFSWFTGATLLIDGVAPSTLGLVFSRDTLSCDAVDYQLTSDGYLDVIVADGLTNASHQCVITVNSSDPAKFFSIAGYKVGGFSSQPLARRLGWLVPASFALTQNTVTIGLTNRGTGVVVNPSLSFPSGLVSGTNTALTTLLAATLPPGQSLSQVVLPVFTGHEISGTFVYHFTLTAQYPDPDGVITNTSVFTALVGNTAVLTVTGTWFFGTQTLFTNIFGPTIEFTFVGDLLTVTTQTGGGRGVMGIYASDNTTLLQSVDCNIVFPETPGLQVSPLTGFGAGSHTVFLRKTVDDSLFIEFVSAAWNVTEQFTQISETVTLNYMANQPVAMPVESVAIGAFDATFAAPILNIHDYSSTPVRQNTDLHYTEVLTRFPTFAVCYKSGFTDILSQYDILIVDPIAAHAADVLAWQANGIKVFGYISSGEEMGFYANRYDFASALQPNAGSGPGGYATYFMHTQDATLPDRDGIWAAYYINPDPNQGWPERIESYYAPQVLGGPVNVSNEVVTTKGATITRGSVIVFDTAQSPIDSDDHIILTTIDDAHTYTTYRDYTFDAKTGAFVLASNISPAVTIGQQLKISYTRKGHHMDGVFFDTVDTPDIYGGSWPHFPLVAGYAANFAAMINNFKIAHPEAWIISNRGFTILPDIIQSCKGVMFESWLTLPTDINNLASTDYYRITDTDTVAANDAVNAMLRDLRLTNEFDVYSLNYCNADSSGNALRAYCRTEDAKRGYLSWQSTITLDTPAPNMRADVLVPNASNTFTRYKTKGV